MINWDELFMSMCYLIASKSKDQKTHIGAVIVGENKEVRSVGYNSFPRGFYDNIQERQERPKKYFYMEHAERNAIYNATLMGVSLKGCSLYVQGIPCVDCARAIIQTGIKEVIIDPNWNMGEYSEKWKESEIITKEIFYETNVKLREFKGRIIQIHSYKNNEIKYF